MLYFIIYLAIGFLGGMILEFAGLLNKPFDGDVLSPRSRLMGKLVMQSIITIYWPLLLACYISFAIDDKKERA